jgi:hypothetical protein
MKRPAMPALAGAADALGRHIDGERVPSYAGYSGHHPVSRQVSGVVKKVLTWTGIVFVT